MIKKILPKILILLIIFFASFQPVYAGTLQRKISREITIDKVNTAHVKETHSLSWDESSTYFPKKNNYEYFYVFAFLESQNKDFDKKISNFKVTTSGGDKVPFTTKKEDGYIIIKANFYEDLSSYNGLSYEFTFDTQLYSHYSGGLLEIVTEELGKDAEYRKASGYTVREVKSTTIKIAQSLGIPNYIYPAISDVKTVGGYTQIKFNDSSIKGKSIRIVVGTERLIRFELKTEAQQTNSDTAEILKDVPVNYIDVILPSSAESDETRSQEIYFESITPKPSKIYSDVEGNIVARIPVSATNGGEVKIIGIARIKEVSFERDNLQKWRISDIPPDLKKYTLPASPYWASDDSQITEIATKLISEDKSIYKTVLKDMEYVTEKLKYRELKPEDELVRIGALNALSTGQGVCMEYADLLISLLRAQGIPARAVYGDGVGPLIDKTLGGVGHQWVSVWFPEYGWIPFDPTWTDEGREYFGYDLDHLVWYTAGESPNSPNGLLCLTWDNGTPCSKPFTINTVAIESKPDFNSLQTLQQIKEELQNTNDSFIVSKVQQPVIEYISGSKLGRFLVSTRGVLIVGGLFAYFFLAILIKIVSSLFKRVSARS